MYRKYIFYEVCLYKSAWHKFKFSLVSAAVPSTGLSCDSCAHTYTDSLSAVCYV
jgi:hypothetical protein